MSLDFSVLIRKTLAIIKQDHYILYPPIILYFILSIIDVFFPISVDLKPGALSKNLQFFMIGLGVIHIYTQALLIAMGKSILETTEIKFLPSVWLSLRKVGLILLLSVGMLVPAGLILVLTMSIPVLKSLITIIAVWAIIVILPLISIIMINDDLGLMNTLYKIGVFIRMNMRNFFFFSTYYISLILVLMFMGTMLSELPHIGRNFIVPIFQGLQSAFFVILTYVFYLELNVRKC